MVCRFGGVPGFALQRACFPGATSGGHHYSSARIPTLWSVCVPFPLEPRGKQLFWCRGNENRKPLEMGIENGNPLKALRLSPLQAGKYVTLRRHCYSPQWTRIDISLSRSLALVPAGARSGHHPLEALRLYPVEADICIAGHFAWTLTHKQPSSRGKNRTAVESRYMPYTYHYNHIALYHSYVIHNILPGIISYTSFQFVVLPNIYSRVSIICSRP